MKEGERYCGNCCWFHGEMTDGEGFCAEAKGEAWGDYVCCYNKCRIGIGGSDNFAFVSRQEMRHHMAVLLQWRRVVENPLIHRLADYSDVEKAQRFSYSYMKVFSKL